MNELLGLDYVTPVDRAIALAEAALRECDERGYVYAAIDLSSALDKLVMIRGQIRSERERDGGSQAYGG